MIFGKRLRPERVRFSTTRLSVSRVLEARNRNVPDFADECGQYDLPDVTPEVCLELETTFAIEKQVLRESCPILAKTLIERILAHRFEPVTDRERIIEVRLVLLS
jgi:hypothetical protein